MPPSLNLSSVFLDSGTNIPYSIADPNSTNKTNSTEEKVEPSALTIFSTWYARYFGYICITVCVIGIILNVLNMIVLTRKHMFSSTNLILTALAMADFLKMTIYLPYLVYMYIVTKPMRYGRPKGWIIFILWNNNFTLTCHTIAMWLTVTLAVFRYIVVCHPQHGPKLCNIYRAKVTIASTVVATCVSCIPQYMLQEIHPIEGGYWFEVGSPIMYQLTFWLYGVVIKIVPCILLTLLSGLLIKAMWEAEAKRAKLKNSGKRAESERTHEHNRTTAMLVAVVLTFVLTELPQGILSLINGILGKSFMLNVYAHLGDLLDTIVLINSAVNFLLYCAMSKQFRDTFASIFVSPYFKKKTSTQNGGGYRTITTNAEVTRV